MSALPPPIDEGVVELRDGRRLAYAEYGAGPGARPVLWFHGTPGARGQVPPLARQHAAERGWRIIAIERPGTGGSTGHLYSAIVDHACDVEQLADELDLARFGIIGLSGGGPYVLACAHRLRDRVVAACVLGGVAPTQGEERAVGGVAQLAARFQPLLAAGREPLGIGLTVLARTLAPLKNQAFALYMRISPEGDQRVFARPEMKEMFISDLMTAARRSIKAPAYDAVLFGRHWGFSVRDITVPVYFWHGDADNIVPLAHVHHLAALVGNSVVSVRPGESHLGSLDAIDEIFSAIETHWPSEDDRAVVDLNAAATSSSA
jgi:pimeloyl-ACP methyl ester carboxylesterase